MIHNIYEEDYEGQALHSWQIVVETDWKLDYVNIDSEDDELTDDLFRFAQKTVKFESKILSITRIN